MPLFRRSAGAIALCIGFLAASLPVRGQEALKAPPPRPQETVASSLMALIRADKSHVSTRDPVWIDFMLINPTSETAVLAVPDTEVDAEAGAEVILPLPHVFSGRGFSGLHFTSSRVGAAPAPVGYQPPAKAATINLAPHGMIGCRVDMSQYYPLLKTPGSYRLRWRPYGGRVESNELVIQVASLKQAVIDTDFGPMTLRFYYDEAPNHAANFVELVEQAFYNNLTFHNIYPGYLIQGGCPRGDGTGIRPDGVMLKLEPNSHQLTRGAVAMSRKPSDPDSASCQFFICHVAIPEMDGQYTVFAYLYGSESFETLSKLVSQPVDSKGKPKRPIYIRSIRLEDLAGETRSEVSSLLNP